MDRDDPSFDDLSSEAEAMPLAGGQQIQAGRRPLLSRKLYLRILAVLIVVSVTATIFVFRDRVANLEAYGYLGAFLISLITSATIILPVPGIAVIFALGATHDPVLIGLASGAGSALGEVTGYMAGYSGQAIVENNKTYMRLVEWMRRRGSIAILLFSFVPNPFFDLAGAAAGMLRFPLWKFLLLCFLGKSPRNMLVALAGAWAFTGVLEFFDKYF